MSNNMPDIQYSTTSQSPLFQGDLCQWSLFQWPLFQWIDKQKKNIASAYTVLNHLNNHLNNNAASQFQNPYEKIQYSDALIEALTAQLVSHIESIAYHHTSITALFRDIQNTESKTEIISAQIQASHLQEAKLQYEHCQLLINTFAQAYYDLLQSMETESYKMKRQMIHTRNFLEQLDSH